MTASDENTAAEATSADLDGVRAYLSAAFGDTEGVAHVAGGRAGYFDAAGLYKFKPTTSHPDAKWNEAKYRWPAKAPTRWRKPSMMPATTTTSICARI